MNKDETISSLSKLAEACNQGSQIFLGWAPNVVEPALQELAVGIGQQLIQFESELQDVIRNAGGKNLAPAPLIPAPIDRNGLLMLGKISLALILLYYQQAARATNLESVCATIKYQHVQMQQAYEQLVSLHRAA
ncbi:MAG TPA: hypothetical protein VE422_04245 [Terriglobia bacterium]|nr:hypothetical protein [Terriglobia bacterium]